MNDEESCDVLCIGSGAGGLATAITAGHHGADVVVVEKSHRLGGATAYSGGQIWAGATHLADRLGLADSFDDVTSYLRSLGGETADPELREVFVSRSPDAIRFLCERGVPLSVVRGLPDYYYPATPGSKSEGRILEIEPWDDRQLGSLHELVETSPFGAGWLSSQDRIDSGGQAPTPQQAERRQERITRRERCAGPGLAAAMVKAAADHGTVFHPATRAVRLLVGDGGVTGAVVRDGSGERRITARCGVVLATGGYDWNAELTRRFEELEGVESMAPPGIQGDHLGLASEVDAATATPRTPRTGGVLFGVHTPGEHHDGRALYRYVTPGLPHSMIVNAAGRRFADDSFHPDLVAAMADHPSNWPAWLVVDGEFRAKYPVGAVAPGAPLPPDMAVETAASLADLAEAVGIDADGLLGEVRQFNEFCSSGRDEKFGRGDRPYTRVLNGDGRMPNPNLGPVAKPPFHAFPLTRVGLNCPAAGLVTGPAGDVRSRRGHSVPGLFAVGNAAAQRDIGATYNSGMGNQRGLLYGYLAARAMTESR